MKSGSNIHVPLWMSYYNVGYLSTFHLAPSSRQMFNLSKILVYDLQKYLQNMTFPSASTVLCIQC